MGKILTFIKNIKLTKSDIFLVIGFLFFIPFAGFSWKFMVTFDPSTIFFNNQMIIFFFTISFIFLCLYIYQEFKKGNIKNNIFFWLFLLFAVLSVVTVLVQPEHSVATVICKKVNHITEQYYPGTKVGDAVTVYQNITATHKLFFSMASLLITMVLYIVLGVFPKRHKDFSFFLFVCYIVAAFMLVITIYSYITEGPQYPPFFKAIIEGDAQYVAGHNIYSFLVHRVPYGACLMMGLMFILLAHHVTHQKRWLFIGLYVYLNLMITWCKTSMLISSVILVIYVVFLLVSTFKRHKVKNIVYACIFGTLLLVTVVSITVSILTKGKFIFQIYNLTKTFDDFHTIKARTYIWENIRNQLHGGWFIIGRGFGTHNLMLYPMNLANGDNVCPSHSSYYAILGAGGIISLLGFAVLFGYYVFVFIKCFKVDKAKTIGLALPVLAYFVYSFTEGTHHLWMSFMFPLILYYNILKKEMSAN